LYHTASFASRGASVYLYLSGLPIDLWVVVLEPGIAKDHALLSEAGDGEECPFGVSFVRATGAEDSRRFLSLNYAIEYVTTHLQEIPQRIR